MLDIGSTSAQLQTVDLSHGGPLLPAYAIKQATLLGQEVTAEGLITPVASQFSTSASAC